METEERRRKNRVDSLNLLEVSVDDNEIIVDQGPGRTLNVSESGILLETPFPIDLDSIVSLTVAVEDELIQLNGKVVRFNVGSEGMYEAGVEFLDVDESALETIRKLVTIFQKH